MPLAHRSTPFLIPLLAATAAGMRLQLASSITPAVIVAIILLPVWVSVLHTYRYARTLLALGLAGVAWGAVVTALDASRSTSASMVVNESMPLLSMLGALGLLLWCRSMIGVSWTAIGFAIGMLANVAITGGNPANLWKYSLSYPIAIAALGIAMRLGRGWELLVLAITAVVSALSDSRSFTSFVLIAAVLVVVQVRPASPDSSQPARRGRPWQVLTGLVVLALALSALLQALIVDGVLGEAAAQRSAAQLHASGSLIAGGRPELGAAIALLARQPWGYGSGTLPGATDVMVAKTGMSQLNYDANNGYVERFMFGSHYEVHSVLGDLWIRFGPLAAAFGLLLLGTAIYALALRTSLLQASGLLALLAALGAWDMFFSPLLTSYNTLALLFVLATASGSELRRRQPGPSSRRVSSPQPWRVGRSIG